MKLKGLFLAAVLCFSGNLWAYSGGSGTAGTPYRITNVADFQQLSATPTDWNKVFILTANINLTGLTFTQAPIAPDTNSTSNDFQGTQFTGVFDGDGRVISNLTITASAKDYVGLFGYVGSSGKVKNLGVVNVNMTGRDYVGGLVGENLGGILTGCYATGSVTGIGEWSRVGGLVGSNGGTLSSCYATSLVTGTGERSSVGGLVGGGGGTLTACYASGSVTGTGDNYSSVGGLMGWNYGGTITSCYATGSVIGVYYVGGLVGYNDAFGATLTSCYATGSVSGTDLYTGYYVGGLVGWNRGTLIACYATGSVSGTDTVDGLTVGGLVGENSTGTITACFWNIQTSDQTGSFGGKGLTTDQMKNMSIYGNAGWANRGWVISDGADYPRLSWQNMGGVPIPLPQAIPLVGSGTAKNPYLISTAQEFALLSWYSGVLNKQIKLTADLDLSGIILYPIGDLGQFTGVFDGSNHTISNAVISQPDSSYVGLFGYVFSGGLIRNLSVENVNITGRYYVGGLVGYNSNGTISNCYVTGAISGTEFCVGGLVGVNGGSLAGCYAGGSVTGTGDDRSYVGGLVGSNWGSLTSCYSTGSVSGTGDTSSYVGGLVGYNQGGALTACYVTGSVSGVYYVGGLVGYNGDGATLTSCYTTGSVTGTDVVGGVVGSNNGALTTCYSTGPVSGSSYVGGLVGMNRLGVTQKNCTITSCYVAGSISGSSYVGGLVGVSYSGSLIDCYATGSVNGGSYVGGLVGHSGSSTITACFWDMQTSGQTTSAGGTGKTTLEMKTESTFTDAGWDFVGETANGRDDVWMMPANGSDYPKLLWQTISNSATNQFGTVPGKTNTKLTVSDSYGVPVTFSLTGGGYGEVIGDANDQITLYDTGEKSLLTISTPTGRTTNISNITAAGSLKGITAKTTELLGDITITGSLGSLTLNDINDSTISIGLSSNPKAAVAIKFDRVSDLTINSQMPIKSILATDWTAGDINAPSVGSITTKGDKKRVIPGDLHVNVLTSGIINTVKIAGTLSGSWDCNIVKSITAADINEADLLLSHAPDIKVPALGKLTVKNWIASSRIFSGGNIGTISAGGIVDSICFAGSTAAQDIEGDGGPDGVLDLPDPNTDINYSEPATIKSIAVKGIKGWGPYFTINSNFAAANILSISLAYPQNDNGGVPFGVAADYIKKLTIKDDVGSESMKELDELGDGGGPYGDAEIRLY